MKILYCLIILIVCVSFSLSTTVVNNNNENNKLTTENEKKEFMNNIEGIYNQLSEYFKKSNVYNYLNQLDEVVKRSNELKNKIKSVEQKRENQLKQDNNFNKNEFKHLKEPVNLELIDLIENENFNQIDRAEIEQLENRLLDALGINTENENKNKLFIELSLGTSDILGNLIQQQDPNQIQQQINNIINESNNILNNNNNDNDNDCDEDQSESDDEIIPIQIETQTPTPMVTQTPTPMVTQTPTPMVTQTPTPVATLAPTEKPTQSGSLSDQSPAIVIYEPPTSSEGENEQLDDSLVEDILDFFEHLFGRQKTRAPTEYSDSIEFSYHESQEDSTNELRPILNKINSKYHQKQLKKQQLQKSQNQHKTQIQDQ